MYFSVILKVISLNNLEEKKDMFYIYNYDNDFKNKILEISLCNKNMKLIKYILN